MVKKFFKLDEHETTVSKELLAGATTFFAMVYIISLTLHAQRNGHAMGCSFSCHNLCHCDWHIGHGTFR